jgi:rare lipoprotein A
MMRKRLHFGLLASAVLLLSACSGVSVFDGQDGAPNRMVDVTQIPDPVPRYEPYSKYGNPSSYEVFGKTYHVLESAEDHVERGIASWYGTKFHGKRTSSGEPYDMYQMTAAHKTLPLPTYAEVTNLDNGRKIIVKINDRGPFHEGRIIDLSYAAAIKLGINEKGTGNVEVKTITPAADGSMRMAQSGDEAAVTPIALAVTAPVAASVEPVAPSKVYLQVASFTDRENMQNLVTRLLEADIGQIQINQGVAEDNRLLYRVRIGPMVDRDSAGQTAKRLNELGIANPYVVVD